MATPSFRSVWLLTCVAAFSTMLHLNQNSIRLRTHPLLLRQSSECLLVDLCDPVISSEEFEACGIPSLPTRQQVFLRSTGKDQETRPGWPRLGQLGEPRSGLLRVCFQLSCQRECGYHLSARHSSKHVVHKGHLQWAQILFPATSCSPTWQVQ